MVRRFQTGCILRLHPVTLLTGSGDGFNSWQTNIAKRRPDTKRPPGNRAAFSLGRIVPTEAKPSELSGEILWSAYRGVKAKSKELQVVCFQYVKGSDLKGCAIYVLFLFPF
jgi:hypothetical protein